MVGKLLQTIKLNLKLYLKLYLKEIFNTQYIVHFFDSEKVKCYMQKKKLVNGEFVMRENKKIIDDVNR